MKIRNKDIEIAYTDLGDIRPGEVIKVRGDMELRSAQNLVANANGIEEVPEDTPVGTPDVWPPEPAKKASSARA